MTPCGGKFHNPGSPLTLKGVCVWGEGGWRHTWTLEREAQPPGLAGLSPGPFEVPSMGWAGRKPWATEADWGLTYPLPCRLSPHCAVRLGFCCQSPGRGQPGTWPHYVPDLGHTSPTQGLGLLEASSMGQRTSPQNSWRPAQLFGGGGSRGA